MKKALIKCAPGSGLHETYWGTLKLSLEANKSMSNGPHRSCMALKTSWDKDHSVESRRALDIFVSFNILRPWDMGGTKPDVTWYTPFPYNGGHVIAWD